MIAYSKLKHLVALSNFWSVDEALWVLKTYQCEHDRICWRSYWMAAHKLRCIKNKYYRALLVKVKFFGGPSGTCEYIGSLAMLVVDRVLARWQSDKIDWSWLLHFTSGTTLHIKDQLGQFRPDSLRQMFLLGFEGERNDHSEPSFDDYADGERIIDYVKVGNDIYPILESGRQGHAVQQVGHKLPRHATKASAESDDGAVHRWSSSGMLADAKAPTSLLNR